MKQFKFQINLNTIKNLLFSTEHKETFFQTAQSLIRRPRSNILLLLSVASLATSLRLAIPVLPYIFGSTAFIFLIDTAMPQQ